MKTKFKIIIVSILMLIALMILPNNVSASTVASGNCGPNASDSITWTLDSNGTLTLSGSGTMGSGEKVVLSSSSYNYVSYWNDYSDKVKSVVFNGNITSIGSYAFKNNINLTNIVIPDTVTSLGQYSFYGCSSLKDVTLSKNIVRIYTYAFYGCTSLKEIEIPNPDIVYIYNCAFQDCTSLEKVTIKANNIYISDYNRYTFPETTKICAYKYTSAFYYARQRGRTFVDIYSGEESTETWVGSDYLNLLPTENIENYGLVDSGSYSSSSDTGEILSFKTTVSYETDLTNSTYKEIKAKVDELTTDCSTEKEKAISICNWVCQNMTYSGSSIGPTTTSVYSLWSSSSMSGNCMSYTYLSNFMLSLAGIPTGVAIGQNHIFTIAFIDGKWVYIDVTHGIYGNYDTMIHYIVFAYDGVVYVINDINKGAYISGIAQLSTDISNITSFTFPDNSITNGIYLPAFSKISELRATSGTVVADAIQNNRECVGTDGTQIVGRLSHISATRKENVVEATYTSSGSYEKVTYCENCGKEISRIRTTVPALSLPFTDVSKSSWYHDAVAYCYTNNIIAGMNEKTYSPNTNLTRGMLVTILYRMEGSPSVSGNMPFTDVSENRFYSNAVKWAESTGVVNGYGNGIFKPDNNITREQLACILFNYANYKGKNTSQRQSLDSFTDGAKVSNFAKEPMQWAVANGVINGSTSGGKRYLKPGGTATRAETTGMIYNFCTSVIDY